jgi:hypothetical protein
MFKGLIETYICFTLQIERTPSFIGAGSDMVRFEAEYSYTQEE